MTFENTWTLQGMQMEGSMKIMEETKVIIG
jgi:hypothetical protein